MPNLPHHVLIAMYSGPNQASQSGEVHAGLGDLSLQVLYDAGRQGWLPLIY